MTGKKKSFRAPLYDELTGSKPAPAPPPPAPVETVPIEPATVKPTPAGKKPALYKTARKVTLYLDEELVARCKAAAYQRRITLSEWLAGAAQWWLSREE